MEQGQLIANAAKRNNVVHFIFSSLPNVQKESKGELQGFSFFQILFYLSALFISMTQLLFSLFFLFLVKHFTDKALVSDYIKTLDFKVLIFFFFFFVFIF
jgi:hypothetical protein